jgi:hypothetical protein
MQQLCRFQFLLFDVAHQCSREINPFTDAPSLVRTCDRVFFINFTVCIIEERIYTINKGNTANKLM